MMPLWILAILSMIIGSLGAAVQTNVKRLLAFSGVTHAGYLMLALVGLRSEGIQAGAFYMAAYLFMNLGVFAIVVWLTKDGREGETLSDFAGLFYRRPVLAISMTLFLLSLAGFPPAGGFPGKIFLIFSALASGVGNIAGWLVGTLVATTGISAYAYLKVVATMFRRGETAGVPTGIVGVAEAATTAEAGVSSYGEEARVLDELEPEDDLEGENEEPAEEVDFSWAYAIVVAVAVLGTLYLGILPNSALVLAEQLLPLP